MNAVRRLFGLFQNSPTFDRDRANLISGFTIGTTALVLNTAILIMVLPLMMYPNDGDFRTLTQNIEVAVKRTGKVSYQFLYFLKRRIIPICSIISSSC